MKGNRKAAQPANRSRQTSLLSDTAIIASDVMLGILAAFVCVGVPFAMSLLKCWGAW